MQALHRIFALFLYTLIAGPAWSLDARALWDFDDPAASEARFLERLRSADTDDALSLKTQIARSLALRSRFDEANLLLDQVQASLAQASEEPRVRYLLERGRVLRATKQGPARAPSSSRLASRR